MPPHAPATAKLFVELLSAVAWADNRLSPSEFDWLKDYTATRTQLSEAELDAVLDRPPQLEALFSRLSGLSRAQLISLLFEVHQLLMADGRAKPEEIAIVDRIAAVAGIAHDRLADLHEWLKLVHQSVRLGNQLFGSEEMSHVMSGLFWIPSSQG